MKRRPSSRRKISRTKLWHASSAASRNISAASPTRWRSCEKKRRDAHRRRLRQLAILAREQREANAEEFRQRIERGISSFHRGRRLHHCRGLDCVWRERTSDTEATGLQSRVRSIRRAATERRCRHEARQNRKPTVPPRPTARLTISIRRSGIARRHRPASIPSNSFVAAITPELPRGALPELIEKVSFAESAHMGVDPGVMAMSILTMCAASIPDQLRLKVKRAVTDRWYQSAGLWTMTIGTASTKKSPAQDAAVEPYRGIDIKVRERIPTPPKQPTSTRKRPRTRKTVATVKSRSPSRSAQSFPISRQSAPQR